MNKKVIKSLMAIGAAILLLVTFTAFSKGNDQTAKIKGVVVEKPVHEAVKMLSMEEMMAAMANGAGGAGGGAPGAGAGASGGEAGGPPGGFGAPAKAPLGSISTTADIRQDNRSRVSWPQERREMFLPPASR